MSYNCTANWFDIDKNQYVVFEPIETDKVFMLEFKENQKWCAVDDKKIVDQVFLEYGEYIKPEFIMAI